jgi:hypothetical protein
MNSADIEKRIAALERLFHDAPVVLHMPDGETHTISGSAKHFFALVEAARLDACDAELAAELEWLRDCVRIEQPAHLFEILQVRLAGAVPRGEVNPN